jgi:hypothetical protein
MRVRDDHPIRPHDEARTDPGASALGELASAEELLDRIGGDALDGLGLDGDDGRSDPDHCARDRRLAFGIDRRERLGCGGL